MSGGERALRRFYTGTISEACEVADGGVGGGRTREGRTNRVTGQIVPPVTMECETLLRGSFRSARCFGVSVVKALGKFVGFDVELKIK